MNWPTIFVNFIVLDLCKTQRIIICLKIPFLKFKHFLATLCFVTGQICSKPEGSGSAEKVIIFKMDLIV